MKVSDYIVNFLVEKGVTDVFGMPGGVVLDFLDSIGKRKGEITAHLNYNEQASALAACGYAQASGKLAVAYATRGPGITNMITGIMDSYCDSLPVFFITAHTHKSSMPDMRIEENQEFDTVKMLTSATKYAVKIEQLENVCYEIEKACYLALNGRPGPVLIDFLTAVLKGDIDTQSQNSFLPQGCPQKEISSVAEIIDCIELELKKSKRPILLIGDGIKASSTVEDMKKLVQKWNIPVLSSRFAQDIMPDYKNYYGYIGSHGIRYSNFILSKCDLIISLGNRIAFNPNSKTFGIIAEKAKIIRIDVDKNEFYRKIPNSRCFVCDLKEMIPLLTNSNIEWRDAVNWLLTCGKLKEALENYDTDFPVNIISEILKSIEPETIITSDVGNNEFLLSRAYSFSAISNRILHSKSFGVLGSSLPKAIGAYYSHKNTVLCFAGDQGLQANIQELQLVAKENIPITIVVLNNSSSGMIRDQQEKKFNSRFLHTTIDSGYGMPDFEKIANCFEMEYFCCNNTVDIDSIIAIFNVGKPVLIEILMDKNCADIPWLPMGCSMQNLVPEIDKKLYEELEAL